MARIRKAKHLTQEAQFIKEKRLNYKLVKILCGDVKGTKEEHRELKKIRKKLKGDFYIDVIYILSHTIIKNAAEARALYNEIANHRTYLAKKLNRCVDIEVAVLDYLKTIKSVLKEPEIVERGKIAALATTAITDESTQTYDRTLLNDCLDEEIERAKRYKRPLSVLFCDLDDFKEINDKFGHAIGDTVLMKTVETIRSELRSTDQLYRYGGEEFVCVLPETDIKGGFTVAQRINTSVANTAIVVKKYKTNIKCTVSIGAVQAGVDGIDDSKKLIAVADKLMYEAKQAGKNCVRAYKHDQQAVEKNHTSKISRKRKKKRVTFLGECISPGCAYGRAFVYKDILTRDLVAYSVAEEEMESELRRIHSAIRYVLKDLQKMKSKIEEDVDKDHADIFEVHKVMLKDKTLLEDLEIELRKECINAEQVVKNIFRRKANKFKVSENEMLSTKADDVEDLSRRILKVLQGYEKNALEKLPPRSIVVAKRLLPSDTVHLKRKNVEGIVVEEGGGISHSAILARALDIPAISNIEKSIDVIKNGEEVLLDGDRAAVIINPTKKDKTDYRERNKEKKDRRDVLVKRAHKRVKTKNGEKVFVCANVSSVEDFAHAVSCGCDSIGLFRTEDVYLASKMMPDEEYLMKQFALRLEQVPHKEVTLRLLDIGADKHLPVLEIENELNPMLGLRGIRVLLKHENLLRTQLKAVLRLEKRGKMRIMIPLVTFAWEVRRVRELMEECAKEIHTSRRKSIHIGAMIETPAAVINVKKIAQQSDFLSIGTNDLIQYTMVAGRENSSVSSYYEEGAKVLMGMLRQIVLAAKKARIECSLCGELAGDLDWTRELLKVGLRNFSVSPHRIPGLKEKIRAMSL